jgi:hypothetical protein
MQSVAHNGFGCPYCRSVMAKQPEEDEETVWSDEEEEEEMFDDDAMRGFRFFWNNLNGEGNDEDDEADEVELEEWAERAAANENQVDPSIPTTDFVAQKLKDQGVTFEQIVSIICQTDHEEYGDNEVAERVGSELFGKIRAIVASYRPEPAQQVEAAEELEQDEENYVEERFLRLRSL